MREAAISDPGLAPPGPTTPSYSRVGIAFGLTAGLIGAIGAVTGALAFVAIPWAVVAVASIPLWRYRRDDPLGPWTFLLASITLGVGLRSTAIQIGWPNNDALQEFLLLGRSESYFVGPGLIMLGAVAAMVLGYVAGSAVTARPRPLAALSLWHRRGFSLATAVLIVATAVAVTLLLGLGGLGRLSQKRFVNTAGAGVFLIALSFAWVLALLRIVGHASGRVAARGIDLVVTAGAIAVAVAIPFYASSRSSIGWVVGMALLSWYLVRGRINVRAVAVILVTLLVITQLATLLRTRSDVSLGALTPAGIAETLVINRNFAGLPKTAHIVNAVPHDLPHENGATLTRAIWGLIPRALWPSKPRAIGDTVVDVVYDGAGGGVPPGLVAESYWNFGLVGTLLMAGLAGFALSVAFGWFRPYLHQPLGALAYSIWLPALAVRIIGSQFSSAIIGAAVPAAVAALTVFVVTNGPTIESGLRRTPDQTTVAAAP